MDGIADLLVADSPLRRMGREYSASRYNAVSKRNLVSYHEKQ
jgi:hypothetical protein